MTNTTQLGPLVDHGLPAHSAHCHHPVCNLEIFSTSISSGAVPVDVCLRAWISSVSAQLSLAGVLRLPFERSSSATLGKFYTRCNSELEADQHFLHYCRTSNGHTMMMHASSLGECCALHANDMLAHGCLPRTTGCYRSSWGTCDFSIRTGSTVGRCQRLSHTRPQQQRSCVQPARTLPTVRASKEKTHAAQVHQLVSSCLGTSFFGTLAPQLWHLN